jgi:hypothetical protein
MAGFDWDNYWDNRGPATNWASVCLQLCDFCWCARGDLTSHGLPHWILSPIRTPAPDLPTVASKSAAYHEAEEQNQRRVFARQRALRLHTSAEFLVEPLNSILRDRQHDESN